MLNLDKRLYRYNQEIEKSNEKKYVNEEELWNLHNIGMEIKNFLISTPHVCPEPIERFFMSDMEDQSLLYGDFLVLKNIKIIKNCLINYYNVQIGKYRELGDINSLISVYEKLFELTNNYLIKKEIAVLKLQYLNNVDESFTIFKEIEKYMENNVKYWFQFADIYDKKKDYFNQILCLQKAMNIEKERMKNEKVFDNSSGV